MKTPKEWLDIFTGQDRTYGPDAAEANIKAIQDEAFKAGLNKTADIADQYLQSMGSRDGMKVASLIKQEILAERAKLP